MWRKTPTVEGNSVITCIVTCGRSTACDNTLLEKKAKEMIDVKTNGKIFKTHLCIGGSERNIRTYTNHKKN